MYVLSMKFLNLQFGAMKFTKIVGGENIDDIIKRAVMFRKKGKKIYMYKKEEE